jgi:hypothetical protein
MEKLTKLLPQNDVIYNLAMRIKSKYPEKGHCEFVAKDLAKELKEKGIFAKHVQGNFHLDQPAAYLFISPLDTENDEYTIDHDWVEVEGVIVDPSATQFRKYVDQEIPDVVMAKYSHPLYTRYELMNYV